MSRDAPLTLRYVRSKHHTEEVHRTDTSTHTHTHTQAKKQPAKHTPFVGYINLFPLLCGALDKETDADKILAIVRTIKAHLLTDFGIRVRERQKNNKTTPCVINTHTPHHTTNSRSPPSGRSS